MSKCPFDGFDLSSVLGCTRCGEVSLEQLNETRPAFFLASVGSDAMSSVHETRRRCRKAQPLREIRTFGHVKRSASLVETFENGTNCLERSGRVGAFFSAAFEVLNNAKCSFCELIKLVAGRG